MTANPFFIAYCIGAVTTGLWFLYRFKNHDKFYKMVENNILYFPSRMQKGVLISLIVFTLVLWPLMVPDLIMRGRK